MKFFLASAATLIVISSIAFASTGGALDFFQARPDGDGIALEWKSGSETGVKSYAIERSDYRTNDFQEIGTVPASGSFSYYKYRDARIQAAPLAGQSGNYKPLADLYKYRLKMNFASEVSYSQTVSVTKPSSGVRRTWGMIKEMFH